MKSALGDEVQAGGISAADEPCLPMLAVALGIIMAFPRLSTWLPSLM